MFFHYLVHLTGSFRAGITTESNPFPQLFATSFGSTNNTTIPRLSFHSRPASSFAPATPALSLALLLRRHGVDLDTCAACDGETLLTDAAANGDADCVAALLAAGAAAHRPNSRGLFPLHCAARSGRLAAVRALLAAGAKVDAPAAAGGGGETALRLAAAAGHADVCEALLAAGAAPSLVPPPAGFEPAVRVVLARHSTLPAAARRAARAALAAVGGWRGALALAAAELAVVGAVAAAAGRLRGRPR